MRRLLGIGLATLAVCLIVNNDAMAQGRGGRGGFGGFGGGFGGIGFLIQNSDVQKELKLSEDQIAKIKEVTDASRPQRGAGGGTNFRDMTEEQRTAFREEARKRSEETNKKITDLLTADQNARLKQLQIWQQGTFALTGNEDVSKELGLTDDQKAALKTISDESGKKIGNFGRVGSFPGQFQQAHAIAVDSKSDIYIVENRGRRVQKFRPVQ